MSNDELKKYLEKMSADICEHFDAVEILASYTDDKGTHFITDGSGNWYARQGMAREFLETEQAETNARAIAGQLHDKE